MDQEDDLRDEKIYHHLAAMESHDDFIKEKQMTKDDTSFLWQNLARYKRAKERGHKSAERFLDETYENFGFFGTLMHKTQNPSGLYLQCRRFSRFFLSVCSSINSKPFKYANLINVRLIGL